MWQVPVLCICHGLARVHSRHRAFATGSGVCVCVPMKYWCALNCVVQTHSNNHYSARAYRRVPPPSSKSNRKVNVISDIFSLFYFDPLWFVPASISIGIAVKDSLSVYRSRLIISKEEQTLDNRHVSRTCEHEKLHATTHDGASIIISLSGASLTVSIVGGGWMNTFHMRNKILHLLSQHFFIANWFRTRTSSPNETNYGNRTKVTNFVLISSFPGMYMEHVVSLAWRFTVVERRDDEERKKKMKPSDDTSVQRWQHISLKFMANIASNR